MYLFADLPYEISMRIFLFAGWKHSLLLKKELQHCPVFIEIFQRLYDYKSREMRQYLQSEQIIGTFARFTSFQRIHSVYNSPKNYVISYVQEYPSFMLYEIKSLQAI